ncbi:MFS transporter [Cupriavidus lacunae]|uniref:MFS transporter n=1 Tax=Cupriavidus lacunae TaxID=2666307 RepID=A0A370NPK0_9BURK|nr:MFS transporter [Cupriavidus lacunae]RDK07524.1 MFS transporter [Cupriavidus lacunae]
MKVHSGMQADAVRELHGDALAAGEQVVADGDIELTYRGITLRLMPLLFICCVLNHIDRINIGYAQLQMKSELGFSAAVYGIGASMFYVGYLLCEIPSNLAMQRIGARKTLLRIMLLWGLASAATLFVRTPLEFYVVRFLLGVFEAGFFPGVVLYLTFWYPPERRARIIAILMAAGVAAGMIAGPLSGWIIQNLNSLWGLKGWQWMFVLQGFPASLLGIIAYYYLTDHPGQATWLSERKRQLVASHTAHESQQIPGSDGGGIRAIWRHPSLFSLAYLYFAISCGAYTLSFWLPEMIHGWGVSNIQEVGFYSLIPYSVGMLAMFWVARRSDARRSHRQSFVTATCVAALGLAATACATGGLWMSMALVSAATAGVVSAFPVFWAIATSVLPKNVAAIGIAAITTLSGLAGVLCPASMGLLKTATGSTSIGLYVLAALLVSAGIVMSRLHGVDRASPPTTASRRTT